MRAPYFVARLSGLAGAALAGLLLLAACAVPLQSWAVPSPSPTLSPSPASSQMPSPLPSLTSTPSPTFTPSPVPCLEKVGRVEREEILSPYLAKPLDYRVYFPPCYDASGATRYPVLYMLHGQTYTDDQWVRLGIAEAADQRIDDGTRPFLIVMPYEVDTFADPYTGGYTDALVETLIPWIDAFYPTCAERECRAVGGLSRGGAYAFLLALDHPDLFAQAGGHSMVPFGGMANRLTRQLADKPASQLPRLWIDMGKNDIFLPNLQDYEQLLTQLAVTHQFTLNPGGHSEDYWSSHVAEYLAWYAAGFPTE
jgi:enterochelin esterase-like enzyme